MTKSVRILLIDDDPDDQLMFLEALKAISKMLECEVVSSGTEALETLSRNNNYFDIIFCDVNMPVMSGYGFLKAVRMTFPAFKIPVIMLSTSSNSVEASRCEEMGALMFITKPHRLPVLIFKIKEILSRHLLQLTGRP